MSGLRSMGLVAGREVREALRRKSFWAVVAVLFVGSAAAMVIPELLHSNDATRYQIALVDGDASLSKALTGSGSALDARVRVEMVATTGSARRQVDKGKVDVAVVDGPKPVIIVKAGENDRLVGAVRQVLATTAISRRLADAGLSERQVSRAFAVPTPKVEKVAAGRANRRAAGFAVSIVLYLLLLTLMIQVANGIAIEKANRVAEVLLPIVRPNSLLFGKVIGVGLTGFAVLVAGLVPVVVKLGLGGNLPNGLGGAIGGGVAWFILGGALYLTLAGGLGALVERQEEAGSAVSPLTFILIGTFFVAQGALDTTLGAVLAYVPLTSPLVEPARLALGVSSPVEVIASLALLLVSLVVAGRVAAVTYQRAIVRTGRRLKLREVLTAP